MKKLAAIIALVTLGAAASIAQAANLTPADYVEIEQLYARYNHAIDSNNAQAWVDTFTADGTFNTSTGREQLMAFMKQWHEQRNGGSRRHWVTNLVITPTANGAEGSLYLMLVDISTRPASIAGTAMYADVLVKTPQGWRFKKREVKPDTRPATPASTPTPPSGVKPE